MDREPESIALVAAILERAILDYDSNAECPYAHGGHRAWECARPVVQEILKYARENDGLTAVEAANEIVETLYARKT